MLPRVAARSQCRYAGVETDPAITDDRISQLVTMQCAKWPTPTIKVSSQIIATWPMVQWLAVTIQATSAINQPPTTPLQNRWPKLPGAACAPNSTSLAWISGFKAEVQTHRAANRIAPAMFE